VFFATIDLLNFGLGLLQAKHLANDDQWKDSNAGYREKHVLTGAMCFPNTVVGSVIGLHPRCTSLHPVNDGSLLVQTIRPTAQQPSAMQQAQYVHTGKLYFSRAVQPLEYKSQTNIVFYKPKSQTFKSDILILSLLLLHVLPGYI